MKFVPQITVIGDINVDLITSPIRFYPKKDRQITVPSISLKVGGSSALTALSLASLGVKTRFIGKVGKGIFKEFLLKNFKERNLDTWLFESIVGVGMTMAITFQDGKRSFISYEGANETLSMRDINLNMVEGKLLHIGGFNLLNSLRRDVIKLLDYAREKGMLTSIDVNWDPMGWTKERKNEWKEILKKANILLLDHEEAKALTGKKREEKIIKILLKMGPTTVGLKVGHKGSYYASRDRKAYMKALKVEAVNTTGAGDAWDAAFLKSYLKGKEPKEILKYANAVAALKLQNKEIKEEHIKELIKTQK
jgi:ribokinase